MTPLALLGLLGAFAAMELVYMLVGTHMARAQAEEAMKQTIRLYAMMIPMMVVMTMVQALMSIPMSMMGYRVW